MTQTAPRDPIDEWLLELAPGRSFIDIGGIGVGAGNERTSFARHAGATRVAQADIRPFDYFEWAHFREVSREKGAEDVEEFDRVDVRDASTMTPLGMFDIVHSTGILYHLPAPIEAVWNLRKLSSRYLILNTVTFPGEVKNQHGALRMPDSGVLFMPALGETERNVLNAHYQGKFGWTLDQTAPRITDDVPGMNWVENGELTPWPYWFLYTDHAFRSMLRLCKLNILKEWKWADHTLQVLCELA